MTRVPTIFPASSPMDVRRMFDEYVSRCDETLQSVFRQGGSRSADLRGWLYGVGNNDEVMAELVHNEPFYLVSMFLGIEEGSQEFGGFEAKYFEFADDRGWL